MKNSIKSGKVLGALSLVAIVSAALGILFAPKKGKATRKQIEKGAKEFAKESKIKMKKHANVIGDKAKKAEGVVEKKIHNLKDEVKQS